MSVIQSSVWCTNFDHNVTYTELKPYHPILFIEVYVDDRFIGCLFPGGIKILLSLYIQA